MTHLSEFLAPLASAAPWIVLIAAAVVFPVLLLLPAPYGRHHRPGWGPSLTGRLAWVVMESPSLVLFIALFAAHPQIGAPLVTVLGGLWVLHYAQRVLIYSTLMRSEGKRQPVLTVAMAIVFNVLNTVGNAAGLAERHGDAAFVLGVGLFAVGFVINVHSDAVLRGLRAKGETGYRVPRGGLFELVTSPNYLGEILEWVGFALAAQSLASLAFAVFTAVNLAPRALAHHRWYRQRFLDYPGKRRVLIPYLW